MAERLHFVIEKLHKRHDRAAFSCGVVQLDDYFRQFASQNEGTGISQHFVTLADKSDVRVLGYYALSASCVAFQQVPDALKKHLPRYPIPVAHLGRLAVDLSVQGEGLGEHLLLDAVARVLTAADAIGIHAVEVVAINEKAKQFYLKYGFTSLLDDERHLYLPLKGVRKLGLV